MKWRRPVDPDQMRLKCSDPAYTDLFVYRFFSNAHDTMATVDASSSSTVDWAGRYYHIDQVLNAGGPRTDPQFAAGDEVCLFLLEF